MAARKKWNSRGCFRNTTPSPPEWSGSAARPTNPRNAIAPSAIAPTWRNGHGEGLNRKGNGDPRLTGRLAPRNGQGSPRSGEAARPPADPVPIQSNGVPTCQDQHVRRG